MSEFAASLLRDGLPYQYIFLVNCQTKKKNNPPPIWKAYHPEDQKKLAAAYRAGESSVQLGKRTIDFDRMVQISEWNNERELRRVDPEAEDYELI